MLTTDKVPSSPGPPFPPAGPKFLEVFIIIVVLMFFSVLAIWGVQAATIVAVSCAAVAVLKAVLPRR